MSKAVSYLAVGAMAFLVGGFSFQLISRAEDGKAGPRHTEVQEKGREANAAVLRYFAIEGMSCQGCADSIAAALTGIPNVRSAKVSLQDRRAVVLAEESQVPTERILAAIAAAGYKGQLASEEQSESATANTSSKQPILVNITRGKNELHAVSMALGLAQTAIKDGRPTVVFLNVEAPIFAAKDLGDDIKYADFPPVKKMFADFVAMGGRVLVCGHCARCQAGTPGHDRRCKSPYPGRTFCRDAARHGCFFLLTSARSGSHSSSLQGVCRESQETAEHVGGRSPRFLKF